MTAIELYQKLDEMMRRGDLSPDAGVLVQVGDPYDPVGIEYGQVVRIESWNSGERGVVAIAWADRIHGSP